MTSTTEERAALADAVAGLLADHDPVDSLSAVVDGPTGYRRETWGLLADQGLLGLLVPESLGGSGGCHGDVVVVCTQMGGVLLQASLAQPGMAGRRGGDAPDRCRPAGGGRWLTPAGRRRGRRPCGHRRRMTGGPHHFLPGRRSPLSTSEDRHVR